MVRVYLHRVATANGCRCIGFLGTSFFITMGKESRRKRGDIFDILVCPTCRSTVVEEAIENVCWIGMAPMAKRTTLQYVE
jgi:hypothetical protein